MVTTCLLLFRFLDFLFVFFDCSAVGTAFFFFFKHDSGLGPFGPLRFRFLISGFSPNASRLSATNVLCCSVDATSVLPRTPAATFLDLTDGSSRLIALWDMKSRGTPAMARTPSVSSGSCRHRKLTFTYVVQQILNLCQTRVALKQS